MVGGGGGGGGGRGVARVLTAFGPGTSERTDVRTFELSNFRTFEVRIEGPARGHSPAWARSSAMPPDDPEHVSYQEGAEVKPPRKASDMAARPAMDAPSAAAAEGTGPGAKRGNLRPTRPEDAALEE